MSKPKTNFRTKGERREARRLKKRHGMRVGGRSVFTIQEIYRRRAERLAAKEARLRKVIKQGGTDE